MISDKDRSGWFGASDTDYIVGNWETKSFEKWWLTKIGIARNDYESVEMAAGTHKEHQILEYMGVPEADKQILIPELRLRINLDGNTVKKIHEVKTHRAEKEYKLSLKHKRQVWVQMFGFESREAEVISYGLKNEDYRNFFLPIDNERLKKHNVEYNEKFIAEYVPKVRYLAMCMTEGRYPTREDFEEVTRGV